MGKKCKFMSENKGKKYNTKVCKKLIIETLKDLKNSKSIGISNQHYKYSLTGTRYDDNNDELVLLIQIIIETILNTGWIFSK